MVTRRHQAERIHGVGRGPGPGGCRIAACVAGGKIQLDAAEQQFGFTVVELKLLHQYGAVDPFADTGNEHFFRFAVTKKPQPVIKPLLPPGHDHDAIGELQRAARLLWQCQDEMLQSGKQRCDGKDEIDSNIAGNAHGRGCRPVRSWSASRHHVVRSPAVSFDGPRCREPTIEC